MILTNPNLTNIRVDIPNDELVKLIRIHLGIDHFVGINDDGYLIDSQAKYESVSGVKIVTIMSNNKATEYEIEAHRVCNFLLNNLKDNLNVKS